MIYRIVTDIATFEKVVDLEIGVWGIGPRDAVPGSILHAIVENGGMLVVAEDGDRIIGLCLGLPARRGREVYLWSHMTGVHPEYQGQGIGYALKLAQRDWAMEHGYAKICWTFDPIQRGNANFNIHRLKASSNIYHVNYYGDMTDSINAGLPSDRLEAVWYLADTRPAVDYREPDSSNPQTYFLTYADSHNRPQQSDLALQQSVVYIEIPADIGSLKRSTPDLALSWRLAVRESMQQAFAQGYSIIDFLLLEGRCVYALTAPAPWFMYVVECSDASLYTGITLDIPRRLRQHNAGKGAAYTATRRPVRLLAAWRFPDQGSALKAEAAFKKQPRTRKFNLLSAQRSLYNGTFVKPD